MSMIGKAAVVPAMVAAVLATGQVAASAVVVGGAGDVGRVTAEATSYTGVGQLFVDIGEPLAGRR